MKNPALEQSLVDLSKDFGVDVLSLPISIFSGPILPPAYTSSEGIFIHEQILAKEPKNTKVYLGHEILHHVLREEEATGEFHNQIVGIAEDYKINQILYQKLGYDVRRVGIRGLFKRSYHRLSVRDICQNLTHKHDVTKVSCGSFGVVHPLILETPFYFDLFF